MNALTDGWYHTWESGSGPSHSIKPHYPRKKWNLEDIPRSFTCLGDCNLTFTDPTSPHKLQSPVRCSYEHEFTNMISRMR